MPFTFRTIARKEQRELRKEDPILVVVELMISQGKTVSIPVRQSDDAFVLSNNFAKTYNLNQAGQKALQDILENHIYRPRPGPENFTTELVDESDELYYRNVQATTIEEENNQSQSRMSSVEELNNMPFQSQSVIATDEIGSKLEGHFSRESSTVIESGSQLTFHAKAESNEVSNMTMQEQQNRSGSPIKIEDGVVASSKNPSEKRSIKEISINVTPNNEKIAQLNQQKYRDVNFESLAS